MIIRCDGISLTNGVVTIRYSIQLELMVISDSFAVKKSELDVFSTRAEKRQYIVNQLKLKLNPPTVNGIDVGISAGDTLDLG